MSMTDPIADMLTRIRNAQKARKEIVSFPASRLKLAIVEVLQQEGYIEGIESAEDGVEKSITVGLKYHHNEPVIEKIDRVSRPGLRVYAGVSDLPTVQGGLGVAIISTSGGVMTDRQARAQGRGGEVLCIVS
ncbi:MAG: 30S ribosomal protein S8 [Gammaproteobacteria bacterium]|nr:30S ribosomal protein S8 [Gammaproteobacteria bacterium]